ncbi:glucose-6-phosphate exchanger SLC37A4-like [Glandiceps talaboti]
MRSVTMGSYCGHQAGIFCAMYIIYMLYIATRKSFTNVMLYIIEERDISKSELGLISSSLMIAYSISKVFSGYFVDKISSRVTLSVGLVLCGAVNICFTLFDSIYVYASLWFVNGLIQGVGWPSCAKILCKWFSPARLGTMWSLLSTSINVSGVLAPFLSTIIAPLYGWRVCNQTLGIFAIFVALLCFLVVKNSPKDVGFHDILSDVSEKLKRDKVEIVGEDTVWDLVTSPFIWVLFLVDCAAFGIVCGCIDWSQLYLTQEIGISTQLTSAFVSALQIGATVGNIVGGYITDRQVAKYGIQRRGSARFPILVVYFLILNVSLHLLVFWTDAHSSKQWIVFLGFLIGQCTFGPVALIGVLCMEHSPQHLSGTAHAIGSSGASVGAVLSGLPLSYIAIHYDWAGAFVAMEITAALALILMILAWRIPSRIGRAYIKTE